MVSIAQKNDFYPSSDSIMISGLVNKQMIFTTADLSSMPDSALGSINIINHRGEFKSTFHNVRAIPLKRLLENSLQTLKPKEMNSLYFNCRAMDGYKVVFSYNEIFNNSSTAVFIITAYDNIDLKSMPERPILLATTSAAAGRLGMRGLKSIEIKKAE